MDGWLSNAKLEKSEQARIIGCNGIHYNVIFWYGYCYSKEIEGLHDQPAARACAKG